MSIINFLEYYFTKDIISIYNKYKNTKIQKHLINMRQYNNNKKRENLNKLLSANYHYLTDKNYNKRININRIEYTCLKIPIQPSESLKQMAKQCLKNILISQKILVNNKPIHIKECVIMDIIDISTSTISGFHTDYEYSTFTGNAFNVWYLIENCENYGNMFILESSDYKKKYTPCCINYKEYNIKDKQIPLKEVSYLYELTNVVKNTGYLNIDNIKISYTNLKNGECIVMSKHLLHRGDDRRNDNVKGFHFRVLIKNEDGSIDYNKYYKPSNVFPKHRWDQENKKLYGVELFDFV